ncbi:MAG: hypothetical protein AAFV53_31620 [Myxococcota bacterium]
MTKMCTGVRRTSIVGEWRSPDDDFIWTSAQIFPRRASAHPHDYWVIEAGGACLASSAVHTAARFDPATQLLHFTPAARRRIQSPWRRLALPGGVEMLLEPETVDFLQARALLVDGRCPYPAITLQVLCQRWSGVLICADRGLDAARFGWRLPHGGRVRPSRLMEIDNREDPPRVKPLRLLADPDRR